MGNLALNKPLKASALYKSDMKDTQANNGDVTEPEAHYASHSSAKDPFWRVDLLDLYLVTTVEIVTRVDGFFYQNGVMEVRVGNSLENEGNSNPLCGEPKDLSDLPRHVYRCELYGRYVNVKKSNIPTVYILILQEVFVNKEPTTNVAFGKTTFHSSRYQVAAGSDKAVDGTVDGFNSKPGHFPHWCMIDLGETIPIVKIFLVHIHKIDRLNKMIVTIGDSSTDHGKDNPRMGGIHDFSKSQTTTLYNNPRMSGRYATIESLRDEQIAFKEIELYSESMRKYLKIG
ncbi:Hypothetical predicted protein [Paramuricea clavata]|uniref:Uncharacterized protein n=1 Tax=Paramuricea clavata TaxID=317549 RepID=A0A7D9HR70_PARCT|nr:Hypothetical predicted protein [Paramuricea clavata]